MIPALAAIAGGAGRKEVKDVRKNLRRRARGLRDRLQW